MPKVKFVGKGPRLVFDKYMGEDDIRDVTDAQAKSLEGDKDFVFLDSELQKEEPATADILEVVTGESPEAEEVTAAETEEENPAPKKVRAKSTRKK